MADQLPVDSIVSPPPPPASAAAEPTEPTSAVDEMRAVNRKMAMARNRMLRRLFEVTRRVDHAREALDVRHVIADHPLAAVGIALGVGALIALPGSGRAATRGKTVPARIGGLLGVLAIGLARDAAGAWVKRAISSAPAA